MSVLLTAGRSSTGIASLLGLLALTSAEIISTGMDNDGSLHKRLD